MNDAGTPSFLLNPKAYAIMQTLTGRGLTPSTVLLVALRTARASSALASDLSDLLKAQAGVSGATETALDAEWLPAPAATDVIDLATVITREMLGHTLVGSPRI